MSENDTMKVMFFCKQNADRLYDQFEVGKSYNFAGGKLRGVNPDFPNDCTSVIEMTLDETFVVVASDSEDAVSVPVFDNDVVPISELTLMNTNPVIKACITSRGQLKTFNNNGRNGCVFSVTLDDESGVDIQASFFNDVAEKFQHLEENVEYTFSDITLRKKDDKALQYTTTSSPFMIVFNVTSEATLV
jgi:hypothetical protein